MFAPRDWHYVFVANFEALSYQAARPCPACGEKFIGCQKCWNTVL